MAVAAAINRDDPADVRLLTKMVQAIADEAAYCGINMPYIPVLDVNKNPDNPVVCTRAFSDDPEVVAWLGTRYIRVLEEAGLVSCAKYFPGHGDTMTDMHAGLPVVEKLYQELLETDVMPYRHAIVDGLSSVMVGHLNIFAIDGKPASMSVNVVTGLLRYKLGFGGLVQTDALNIGALRAFGSVPATCLNAGVDLIVNPENVEETVRELIEAVRNGEIEKERIEIALSRIERAKSKIRCAKDRPLDGAAAVIDYEKHRLLSRRITEKSITLVKGTPGFIGVGSKDTITVVLAGDDRYFASSPLRNGLGPLSVAGNADVAGRTVLLAVFYRHCDLEGEFGYQPRVERRTLRYHRQSRQDGGCLLWKPLCAAIFLPGGYARCGLRPFGRGATGRTEALPGRRRFYGQAACND